MKFPQSFNLIKAHPSLIVAGTLSLLALSNSAEAIVTVTFSQSGANVIGVISGNIILPDAAHNPVNNGNAFSTSSTGSSNALWSYVPGLYDEYTGGTNFGSSLNKNPDSFSGTSTFGFLSGSFLTDGSAAVGGSFTPNGTWTWSDTTLADIGLGGLTSTPITVYRAHSTSNDTIQFAAVPEPSSFALLGLGATSLLVRRRRLAWS
jgi:hypothetical protein